MKIQTFDKIIIYGYFVGAFVSVISFIIFMQIWIILLFIPIAVLWALIGNFIARIMESRGA